MMMERVRLMNAIQRSECECVPRHVPDAGHVHAAAGGGGRGGRARHRGARAGAARALHTDARPVRLLPPRRHRVRGAYTFLFALLLSPQMDL
jgi:hypothetical protein